VQKGPSLSFGRRGKSPNQKSAWRVGGAKITGGSCPSAGKVVAPLPRETETPEGIESVTRSPRKQEVIARPDRGSSPRRATGGGSSSARGEDRDTSRRRKKPIPKDLVCERE